MDVERDGNMINQYKTKVLEGNLLTREEVKELEQQDTKTLMEAADEIRKALCGNTFSVCTIINGKSGRCSEDCTYCSQSAHHKAKVDEYPLLSPEKILESAIANYEKGVHRFSIVTSGKRPMPSELGSLVESYRYLKDNCAIDLCGSHGLMKYDDLRQLKDAGVTRYHNNLETSRRFFPNICTTHSFDEKVETIKDAQRAGLEVCSGGIIGLGESMEDRIDMAFTLRELDIRNIPINILNPIRGTVLENQVALTDEEILKTFAIFRFILPGAQIRLAGGRSLLKDHGQRAITSGVNGFISGDLLTTSGIDTLKDIRMVRDLGFEV